MAITSTAISNNSQDRLSITSRWGITANEYIIDGKQVDLQDLMVAVSKHRAVAVEGEVAPQATRIRARNAQLEELGELLGELTKVQAKFKSKDEGDAGQVLSELCTITVTSWDEYNEFTGNITDPKFLEEYWINDKNAKLLSTLGFKPKFSFTLEGENDYIISFSQNLAVGEIDIHLAVTKSELEKMIQLVKSKIDALNNEAQLDMTRLQQLVDRRDESYSTATNLMTAISDTRANLIRAL